MIINYYGAGFIKIANGDSVVAINPISKKSSYKEVKFGADIAFVSFDHPDTNGILSVTRSGKDIFTIDGPGEYEVKGVFAKGVPSNTKYGDEDKINTIYSIHIDDIHILYLGAIIDEKLSAKILGDIDNIDILFVPVFGDGVIDPALANKMANSLEAKIVIPIFYDKETLGTFLKEASAEGVKSIEKLVIKKRDLADKTGEVVVLSS